MPKIDEATKEGRLERMHLLLARNARGITEGEIAEEMGLERRTANNYLRELEYQGRAFKDGLYWFPLVLKESRLRPFDLSPEEAVTLYLGARLLSKQQDKRNEPAETALLKLAAALKADAGVGEDIEQAARELAGRPAQAGYQPVFREIVRSYIYRKKVELSYKPLHAKAFTTTFSTYLLEPSPVGFSTYLIGHSSIVNALRSYKLERVEKAHLTNEPYAIPPDFPGLEILHDAWSIVMGPETVRVVLRFSPQVRERVLETRWHPSQQTLDDPEKPGWLRWQVQVADTLDLLPWVRGWGADCEALEPEELRGALVREAQELVELYKLVDAKKQLFAHFREKDKDHKEPQYLWDHLSNVSKLAGQFASKVGLKETGEILGLLHDLGKASQEFQNYIQSATGLIDPDSDNYVNAIAKKGKVDHSSAGAQVIYNQLWKKGHEERLVAQVLSLAIASHHSGLIDCLLPSGEDNFTRRMEKAEENTHTDEAFFNLGEQEKLTINRLLADEKLVKQLIEKFKLLKEDKDSQDTSLFKCGLLIRFLLSCLLDADRLDTADFETPHNVRIRNYGQYHPWETLIQRLDNKLGEFENKREKNDVDELRGQVSQACFDFAAKPKGIYQLTVPTGGGKTLASLRFGLNHAAHHKMDRVFYIIPYTSIIDQNAEEVRKILEDKDASGKYLDRVVLEHHSNLTPEEETYRQNLLAQDWDAPVVFITQVQFLEALFGSCTRSARRMHQLANSVIILDEVQTIPINCVHLLNVALRFLVHSCGATVVLCTATQPPLDKIDATYRALTIHSDQRIIPNERELFEKLKRVEVFDERSDAGWDDEEVADLAERQLQEKGSVLIVVNTKKSARALYESIARMKIADVYHLSTNMCPAHRLKVLEEVKDKLKKQEPVICVSTQLIEAGVDIDFGSVIRYLAGLDSITQSAGRCNRHGRQKDQNGGSTLGHVFIVNPKDENISKLKDIKIGAEKTQRLLSEFDSNPATFENNRIGLDAMAAYYQYYFYERKDDMKYKVGADSPVGREDDLFNLLSKNTQSVCAYARIHSNTSPPLPFVQSFQTASKSFRVVDSPTRGVVVPYGDEGDELVKELCGAFDIEKQYKLLKKAQRYSVNLFLDDFKKLADINAIHEVQKGSGVFHLDDQYYGKDFGWSDEPVNDMKVQIV
ncbi:MAG: CRISPR-associated helicase Cas3' [Anaerolineales bacterium]